MGFEKNKLDLGHQFRAALIWLVDHLCDYKGMKHNWKDMYPSFTLMTINRYRIN